MSACGSHAVSPDSRIVATTGNPEFLTVIVDTSEQGITSIRVATPEQNIYEVAPLGNLSAITIKDPAAGYTLTLVSGEKLVHQETVGYDR